jgi:uncharacterized protein YoxC
MYTFLFIISFILHAISFWIIILMYYRLEQTKEIERKQVNLLKDMEDVLTSYVLEMKEENELFLAKVNKDYQPLRGKSALKETVNKSEDDVAHISINTIETKLTDEDLSSLLPKYEEEGKKPNSPRQTNQVEENLKELSIGQQVKRLHKQGLNVEEIAKQLNKGITEIELFLKFN